MNAPLPLDEAERVRTLHEFDILDTKAEKVFDDLTRLATYICRTPMAAISLIDSDRQWFKSAVNIHVPETPRDVAFCAHAILEPGTLVVPDALNDVRFKDNPFVAAEDGVRFYAGAPLTTTEGYKLGTLCVVDKVPRQLSDGQLAALRVLSRQVTAQLELRREIKELRTRVKNLELSTGEKTKELSMSMVR
jgi:GAF domain-containing protein